MPLRNPMSIPDMTLLLLILMVVQIARLHVSGNHHIYTHINPPRSQSYIPQTAINTLAYMRFRSLDREGLPFADLEAQRRKKDPSLGAILECW